HRVGAGPQRRLDRVRSHRSACHCVRRGPDRARGRPPRAADRGRSREVRVTTASRLTEPLGRIVGTRTANSLAKLGLETTGDLLRHYPRRYAAPGQFTSMADLHVGEYVTVMAQVRTAT